MNEHVSKAQEKFIIEQFLNWCNERCIELCEESNDSEDSQIYNQIISRETLIERYLQWMNL